MKNSKLQSIYYALKYNCIEHTHEIIYDMRSKGDK